MTPPENSVMPEYSPPQPARGKRRRWAISEIVIWLIVLILATVTAVGAALEQRAGAGREARAGTFKFTAQYLIGVHDFGKMGAFGGATGAQILTQLDDAAVTPEDRVRVAIVAGEISGHDEARRRLEAIDDPSAVEDAASARAILAGEELSEARQKEFREKYEWFADLAVSVGKPDGDPLRAQTLNAARATFWKFFGIALAVLALAGLGLLLLVLGAVLWFLKKLKMGFATGAAAASMPDDRRSYLQAFAVYLGGLVAMMLVLQRLLQFTLKSGGSALVIGAVEFAALGLAFGFGVSWPLLRGQSAAQWRAALGLHAGRGFFREVGSGILGYVAGLPVLAVGFLITALLVKLSGMSGSHPVNESLNRGAGWLVVVFVLASIWAPVTEELMFRGALFAHLRERFGWWISAPVVAFIFAIIHPQGWVAAPALGAVAMVLAGIREWRGSIIGCITAHAMHNTLTLCVAVMLLRE
jgi:membrane protease YdiL (CAAX protease family)